MKILFLPNNIASISTSTIDALNKLPNVQAKGFFINKFIYQSTGGGENYFFEGVSRLRRPFKWIRQEIERFFIFNELIKWADIIHWIYDDAGLKSREKRNLLKLKKPCVIEWVGSDIRNPEILFKLNPYYKKAFNAGYEYAHCESQMNSLNNQLKFLNYGAYPLVNPEMDIFLNKSLFPKRYFIWPRLLNSSFEYEYPSLHKKRPLILHSPSAKFAKGTNLILPVIEDLKKDFDFDFVLLHKIPRSEVLALMKQCDIFIDQIILGMYGIASVEAMCMGKPVLCYLMPEVFSNGLPTDCPIINTSIETLKINLIQLLTNPTLRNEKGKASRAFAEKYFNAETNSRKLVEIYNEVIGLPKTIFQSE